VIHEKTGLLSRPANPSDLAAKIHALGNSAELRECYGENAKSYADEHFSLSAVAQQLMVAFNSALD